MQSLRPVRRVAELGSLGVMNRQITYPYEPKSARSLLPGQFWSVPLKDGSFACGRVLQPALTLPGASRVIFLAGLMDWHSDEQPDEDNIAGARCIAQGKAHIKTIRETRGAILGVRHLELDQVEPWLFRGARGHQNSYVSYGLEPRREQLERNQDLPILSVWGFKFIQSIAERRFLVATDA